MKTLPTLTFILVTALPAAALDLVVAFAEGSESQTVDVPVTAAEAAGIAAAAFTVTYDTASLDVDATSTFFAPFADQLAASGAPSETTAVTVGATTYTAPFVTRQVPGTGLAVAGILRVPAGESGPADILSLHVRLKPGADPGLYPINLTPTVVADPAAGYDPGGEPLDLLLSFDADTGTFPVLPATPTGGFARFSADVVDLDADGLPDPYETANFGATTVSDGTADFDKDGLSDLLEFLLGTDPTKPGAADFLVSEPQPDGSFVLDLPVRPDHALALQVQWTTDLQTFTADGVTLTPRPDLSPSPDILVLRATIIPPRDLVLNKVLARAVVSP